MEAEQIPHLEYQVKGDKIKIENVSKVKEIKTNKNNTV